MEHNSLQLNDHLYVDCDTLTTFVKFFEFEKNNCLTYIKIFLV